ncbi:MAG: PrgI family mobile element protein [Granulicatella sp.]
MNLESRFYTDVSKYEPEVMLGMTKRQLKTVALSIPGIILIVLEMVVLPEVVAYLVAFLTSGLMVAPPILSYLGKMQQFKKDIEFFLVDQNRVYKVEQIRRYEPSEFIQKKSVKETDRI